MGQKLIELTELLHTVINNQHNHHPDHPLEGRDQGYPPPIVSDRADHFPQGLDHQEDQEERRHFDLNRHEDKDDWWYQEEEFHDNPQGDWNVHVMTHFLQKGVSNYIWISTCR
jgi:hypothetical protein